MYWPEKEIYDRPQATYFQTVSMTPDSFDSHKYFHLSIHNHFEALFLSVFLRMVKQKTKRLFSLYVSARNSICNDRDLLCSACSAGTFAPLYVCLFSCLAVSEESQCWWWWAIYLASIMKNARHLHNLWMLGKHSLTTRQTKEPAGMVVTRNRMGTVEPASISLLEREATAPKSFAICNHWSVNRRFCLLQNKTNFMGKSSLQMVAVAAEEERTTSWKKIWTEWKEHNNNDDDDDEPFCGRAEDGGAWDVQIPL